MGNIMESVYNMLDAVKARPEDDPKVRADAIFTKIDVNNDGELNREEFLMGCQQDQVNIKFLTSTRHENYFLSGIDESAK